jgi:MFS family permease
MLASRTLIADMCSNNVDQRATLLGRVFTAYSLGAAIGPLLGGYLASTNLTVSVCRDCIAQCVHLRLSGSKLGAYFAAVGSLVSVGCVALFIREPRKDAKATVETAKDNANRAHQHHGLLDLSHLYMVASHNSVSTILCTKASSACGRAEAEAHCTCLCEGSRSVG